MPSSSLAYHIKPVQYNSRCISFSEWITLFTLCLAPLIAHIASGAPQVSYLADSRPKWYDSLCQYNPTSILWRYAAITDRRIRATRWDQHDLAATNAIFWTADGWDGGEHMVSAANEYCSRLPELTHVQLFSVTMLKTIITTLQGVLAIFTLLGALVTNVQGPGPQYMGLDRIFFPLAILGLLRLCSATWLTEDFVYAMPNNGQEAFQVFRSLPITDHNVQLMNSKNFLDPQLIGPLQPRARFRAPTCSWRSRIFRFFYLLILGSVLCFSLMFMIPWWRWLDPIYSMTAFLAGLLYSICLTVSIVLYTFYFLRSQTTSTLLPCISTTWYRVYTVLFMGFMLVLVIVAAIETNKGPDGLYYSVAMMDGLECKHITGDWWWFRPSSNFTGLVSSTASSLMQPGRNSSSARAARVYGNRTLLEEESYRIYNFTGYCVGQLQDYVK